MKFLPLLALVLGGGMRSLYAEEPQRHELTFEQRRAINEIKLRGGWVSAVSRTDERIDSITLPPRFSDREFALLEPLRDMPIRHLQLRETNLAAANLRELLTRYSQLHVLRADDPNFADDCLTPLYGSKKLNDLELCRGRITGKMLGEKGRFPQLRELTLEEIRWREADYKSLAGLESLSKLTILKVQLDEASCQRLAELPEMYYLSIEQCAVAKNGWRLLSKCPKLQHLDLDNTGLTNDNLKEIVGLAELEIVFFNQSELTFEGLASLATHPKLQRVSFRPEFAVDQETLKQLDQFLNEPRLRANQKKGHLAGMRTTPEQVEKLQLQHPVQVHSRNYPPDEDKDHWYPPAWLDEAWDGAPEAPLDRRPNRWFPEPQRMRRGQAGPPF
jgi:hypothetical protein